MDHNNLEIISFLKQIVGESNLAGEKRIVIFDPAATGGSYFSTAPLKNYGKAKPTRIESTNFVGNDYVNADLIGKEAMVDFDVIAVEGDGGFLNEGTGTTDGYSFDKVLGKITTEPGKYLILTY